MDLWIPFSEKLLFRLNLTREGVSHCVGTGERTRIILRYKRERNVRWGTIVPVREDRISSMCVGNRRACSIQKRARTKRLSRKKRYIAHTTTKNREAPFSPFLSISPTVALIRVNLGASFLPTSKAK